LIQRLAKNLDNSTKQLCLFLKTILINETGDDCDLLPSQQQQLMTCIQALQGAALNPKNRKLETDKTQIKDEDTSESEDSTETESDTDSGSEADSEPVTFRKKSGGKNRKE
jgi:hypothetical protein